MFFLHLRRWFAAREDRTELRVLLSNASRRWAASLERIDVGGSILLLEPAGLYVMRFEGGSQVVLSDFGGPQEHDRNQHTLTRNQNYG